jgi:hypothetical protein
MTQGIETRLDGSTLVVRIPMRFQRRGGRKRIVAPDGSDIVPSSKPRPDGTLAKARAPWRWQRMLEEGRFASVRELAKAEQIGLSYVSRILRLTLLAPDIVEAVLDRLSTVGLPQLMKPFPCSFQGSSKTSGILLKHSKVFAGATCARAGHCSTEISCARQDQR